MHFHLYQAVQPRSLRSNKDTNGGYGTVNDFGTGPAAVFLKWLKNRTMNFPELLPAYLHAVLESDGHRFTYGVNALDEQADVVLFQTSITNYNREVQAARAIKAAFPEKRVGFVGGLVTGKPDLYAGVGDFIVVGEAEIALQNVQPGDLAGTLHAGLAPDLDQLPFPDWSHLEEETGGYGLLRVGKGRFVPVQASRGCPMSCAFYCTYPLVQGKKLRVRSVENIVAEIAYLQQRFGVTTIMFRDPIFSLKMDHVADLCREILARQIRIDWICETHPKFLSEDLIRLMAEAGCTAIKLGIESGDLEVMRKSNRYLPELDHQEEMVAFCESQGIDVLAFYILGYEDDTKESVMKTIRYAQALNTYGAQFTIATPYPGTPWYDALQESGQEIGFDEDLERYTQYDLVYRHRHLNATELLRLKNLAYRSYYFRPGYFRKHFRRFL